MSEVRELREFCWRAGKESCSFAKRKGMIGIYRDDRHIQG